MNGLETEIRKQAEYAAALSYDALPERVKTRARWVLLDSIGCVLNGRKTQAFPAKDADERLLDTACAMISTELYEGNRKAIGHPACHILPLMLCEGGRTKTYGEFLKNFVAAYEIAARWGSAITFSHDILGHGTVMTSGAVIACGLDKGCTAQEMYEALLVNGSLPEVSVWQSVWDGSALHDAYAGLSAAQAKKAYFLVGRGVRSTGALLESVYHGVMGADITAEKLSAGLGRDYLLLSNYFKVHTGCRFVHPFADLLAEELEKGLDKEEIVSIDVYAYKKAARLTAQSVPNTLAGQFSIPVSLAVLLEKGKLLPKTIAGCADDPAVAAWEGKIRLHEDEAYNAFLPDVRKGRVEIQKADGSRIVRETCHAAGDFDHPTPFTREALIQKFRCCAEKEPEEQTERLIEQVLDGDPELTVGQVLEAYDS